MYAFVSRRIVTKKMAFLWCLKTVNGLPDSRGTARKISTYTIFRLVIIPTKIKQCKNLTGETFFL